MNKGGKTEVIIENFRPSEFIKNALRS